MQDLRGPIRPEDFSDDPFFTYFLASMFRIQALISIMQYAQSGEAEIRPQNLHRQVFQAEYIYFLHDDELWGRSHASLYTAIGLLLNPVFGIPEDGSLPSCL